MYSSGSVSDKYCALKAFYSLRCSFLIRPSRSWPFLVLVPLTWLMSFARRRPIPLGSVSASYSSLCWRDVISSCSLASDCSNPILPSMLLSCLLTLTTGFVPLSSAYLLSGELLARVMSRILICLPISLGDSTLCSIDTGPKACSPIRPTA